MNVAEATEISHSFADSYLTLNALMGKVKDASPVLAQRLSESQNKTIGMFLSEQNRICPTPYQPIDDLLAIVEAYTAGLLGPSIAQKAVADLKKHPMVLTANHHGVDYFAQSLQGSLLFSLLKTSPDIGCDTIPVFACGNVPLNNLTYPRGAMIYRVNQNAIHKVPLLLPLFSDKRKRAIVSAVEPYDSSMIQKGIGRIRAWEKEKILAGDFAHVIESLMEELYNDALPLSLNSYSDQAVVLNHQLWKRLFAFQQDVPDMVYLEIEHIVGQLLTRDLQKPDSLAAIFMLDDAYREKLLAALDGTSGCWNRQRLLAGQDNASKNKIARGSGTHFFWGVDDRGRRFPLCISKSADGKKMLSGWDDRGNHMVFEFSVYAIIELLSQKKLVPSLFTSYLCVALARGLTCIGGYYQSSYMPQMQKGVVNVLEHFGADDIARRVKTVPTDGYLSGMQTVMATIDSQYSIPAGPLEIAFEGGISKEAINTIRDINVYDAHLASLCDTAIDIIPHEVKKQDWKGPLFQEMHEYFS